jgi:hypothetical protein
MINILNLSDIHLGHDKNKTEDIVLNLRRFFKTYDKYLKTLDLLTISGDIFDKLLTTNSADYHLAYEWLTELVMLCKRYSIIFRILEGTPSHDWQQAKLLYNTIDKLNIDLDFKYFDILDIEYIEALDIHILYIPDEWKHKLSDVWLDVVEKMKEKKLDKVDIVIMHGAFSYQLPEFLDNTHDPKLYNTISYGPVITGHVHNRSVYKKILVPGSFDRLNHGDDNEPKGGVYIEYDNVKKKYTFKYLDNKFALEFYTFDVRDKTIEDIKKIFNKYKKTNTVNIRFLIGTNNKLSESILEFKKDYPNINVTVKKEKKEDKITLNKTVLNIQSNKLDKKYILNYIKDKVDAITYNAMSEEVDIIEKLK